MTVQWILPAQQEKSAIYFGTSDDEFWHRAKGVALPIPGDDRYILYRAELTELKPDRDYFFCIDENDKIFNFRTMPTSISQPIRFVVGGDIYHDGIDSVRATNIQAALQSPQFALVGGDIAYAGDKFGFLPEGWQSWVDRMLAQLAIRPAKRQRWIDWLALWKETMVTPEGRLIPMVPTLGNHDVNGGFGKTYADAEHFHLFFPFPGRQGFKALDFGHYMTIVVLDSGHTNPIGGMQSLWLYEALRQREKFNHKFALYHVPAYPSVRKLSGKVSSEVRHFWVPIFDRFNLRGAFEHHEHAYKRTHLLRGGRVDSSGVLYLGDGAWGVEQPRQPDASRWYIAKSASKRHFIAVTVAGDRCHFNAIDSQGVQFDEFQCGN
jgi:hypothetical protein